MDANEKLNVVLKYLYIEFENSRPKSTYNNNKLIQEHTYLTEKKTANTIVIALNFTNKVKVTLDVKQVYMILDQLSQDGYVESMDFNETAYSISFAGIMFHEDGGYTERYKRQSIENRLKEKILTKTTWDVEKMKWAYIFSIAAILLSLINSIPKGVWKSIFGI